MNILFYCGTAVLAAILTLVLRDAGSPAARYVPAAAGILLLLKAASALQREGGFAELFTLPAPYSAYVAVLLRCFGAALAVHITADFIRDLGEKALADKLELCGKCAVLLLLWPVFRELLTLAGGMLS